MRLHGDDLLELCEVAKAAADEASTYIQSKFNKQLTINEKRGGDTRASQIVTEVDLNAQNIILKHLRPYVEKFDIGLLTEELADDQSRLSKDYFWCIDPMDGTLPFSEGQTGYAVSIALVTSDGNPVIGVVNIPDLKECYSAIKGKGVHLNHSIFERTQTGFTSPIQVFMDRSFTEEPYFQEVMDHFQTYAGLNTSIQYHDAFGGVRNAVAVMNAGTSCYFKFPKESQGCGSIWDYAATRLFFEELGLIVSNALGEKLHLNHVHTTFMNEGGILFATHNHLRSFILGMQEKIIDKS